MIKIRWSTPFGRYAVVGQVLQKIGHPRIDLFGVTLADSIPLQFASQPFMSGDTLNR